jgi:hypothetical protein
MAQWTDPKTMVEGAAALSADWNTYIRDNGQYLKDRVQIVTQAEYDELTPDSETIYFVVG